jgi:hypothetical protein
MLGAELRVGLRVRLRERLSREKLGRGEMTGGLGATVRTGRLRMVPVADSRNSRGRVVPVGSAVDDHSWIRQTSVLRSPPMSFFARCEVTVVPELEKCQQV